jgi:hypothetical protein
VLPFIIGGLVLLLVAGGVGLYFLLKDDEPTPVASTTSQSTEPTEDTSSPTEDTEDTETPTEDTDTDSPSGDEPNFPDSVAVADAFLELMIDGDYPTALTKLCTDGQDPSDGDGFADGQALAADFFATLGATTVTGGLSVAIEPSDTDRDVVTYELDTDVGVVTLDVQVFEEVVGAELTICGYQTA